ncbi:glutamine ABC transporter substrate-binding protein [uncultured Desulfuromusa sp.]|uniref:glutamine ABC transporter substrate-binding protein n=1 Tax=uncultured Desulfuromusa sp. TaxID=219183 RepID=UPI002AA831B9|nr:glutamine ABC transporter substrate-binding protein [uncultured Desulfuromusa sp.]
MSKFFRRIMLMIMLCTITVGTVHAKTLIVGVDANFRPFEFKNEQGEFTGFDVQLWDAIAKDLGLDYKWQTMDFNGLIPALQSKSIDAAIAGMTIKSAREEVVDFSYPYYDAGLVILVKADNNNIKSIGDLKGKKVATKLATTSVDFLKSKGVTDLKLLPNTDNLFMELLIGGVDAVLFDSPPLMYYAKNQGQGKVKVVGPLYQGQSYGIAFPQGSTLREKVSITLLKFKENGTYDTLYKRWFGTSE